MKDFDNWNNKKKNLDEKSEGKFCLPRDIWWCVIGLNIGSEQDGNNANFQRPVLVIKRLSNKTCLIASLTTSPHDHTYRISIGSVSGAKSKVILSQIRVIDTKRLTSRIAILDYITFETLKKSLKDFL